MSETWKTGWKVREWQHMANIRCKLDIKSYSNKSIKQSNLLKREADDFLCKGWSRFWFTLSFLNRFCFLILLDLEKAMAPHSSTLAWKIPWTEEPGNLQSMGSLGVGHDWATSLSLFTFMHWRRKWQPTPAFLPEESQGQGSLVGCRLWGRTESDTTEVT